MNKTCQRHGIIEVPDTATGGAGDGAPRLLDHCVRVRGKARGTVVVLEKQVDVGRDTNPRASGGSASAQAEETPRVRAGRAAPYRRSEGRTRSQPQAGPTVGLSPVARG
ncbi:hypothetical protein [Streptomyces tsukubensis]|uniref:Uncharacterized protein n=1 Tax=Streptomyces tsukubensis TaxID=83656 RepID=A0A1V4AFA2_9ACTN|nr:hypothetical protein [Streptomyces tsukubensis]OON82729.1 hypothetical protein B1H18_01430 [Streptomyces tsukubensis]QFR92095.1 hypothetical protein GBW32_02250 [Streptomyces tsukubensis]